MKVNYYALVFCILLMQNTVMPMYRLAQKIQLYTGMEKGPMNPDWFYSGVDSHDAANKLHQNRQWQEAAEAYDRDKDQFTRLYTQRPISGLLHSITPEEKTYVHHMARVNLAVCLMAQRKSSKHWKSFDALIGIAETKRLPKNMENLQDKLVYARTDYVGIGDIAGFIEVVNILQTRTGCQVILSIRDFLKNTFASVATAYNFKIISENDAQQLATDYETHIIGLLGHLKLHSHETAPERVVLAAPERAMVDVAQQIDPVLAQGKTIVMVYAGDKRQATLIGGKQLPRDTQNHGRNLDSQPFMQLLEKYSQLMLMDCGNGASKLAIDEDKKDRCMNIASEEQAFDTLIALALLMKDRPKIVCILADNGPSNVFIRAVDKEAQPRVTFIIPNGSEYDMRMEGEGKVYRHMLVPDCFVRKCETPADQTKVIDFAYQHMIMGK